MALALNGLAAVLGSAGAILISVGAGIPATFATAALFYVIAGLTGPAAWNGIVAPQGA